MDVATGTIGQGLSACMLESDETYIHRELGSWADSEIVAGF